MTQETVRIVKRAPTKYGFRGVEPRDMMIEAVHSWATGYQTLLFRDDAHLNSWAATNNVLI